MPTIFNDDELERERQSDILRARPAILTGSRKASDKDEELSLLQRAGDAFAAVPRGVEGAVQDVYGLADTIAFDILPDYKERVFGESRTGLGGLIEGITNFGVGFAAAGFAPLSWTAKFGRLAPVVKGAVKGAIADFAVFDGHEERLSNLIQSFPGLQNPVSEFLAADEKDGQIEGRFKNVLEGLGLGAMTELGILAFKGLRAGRKARAAGLSAEEVEAAVDRAAPAEAVDRAMRGVRDTDPGLEPIAGQVGAPGLPAAAEGSVGPVVELPEVRASSRTGEDATIDVLATFDIDEAKARELIALTKRRQAPITASATELVGELPLDPRVNPRKLTPQELLSQGMLKSDLNLSRYTGPEGALQYIRATEQALAPFPGLGEASRRTLKEQEEAVLATVADLAGERPEVLLRKIQQDMKDLPALMTRAQAYKVAMQASAEHAYRLGRIASEPNAGDVDILKALHAMEFQAQVQLGVKNIQGEVGRGLGMNRISTPFMPELLDKAGVEAALHEKGGRKRLTDLIAKYRTLYDSTTDPVARAAKTNSLVQASVGKRSFGILNEYWYNSLLGRPTTLAVNAVSNALNSVLIPLERIAGGVLTADGGAVARGASEIVGLVQSASEAFRATSAAMRGGGGLLDPKSLLSDINDVTRKAITAENVGLVSGSAGGEAVNWLGKLVRMPSAALTATDQFFQQLNYRALARSELTHQAITNPTIGRAGAGAFVQSEMDKLIFRGQAYSTAQLYHRGVEDAIKKGLRSKVAVDDSARRFVTEAMASPEHARLSALGSLSQQRAARATFTEQLKPGTLSYRVQEAVLNHWYLRMVMPFVRTPVNIIGAALDRTVNPIVGVGQLLAQRAFPKIAPSLERSRNLFVKDMLSKDPRRKADAIGRLALGMSTAALIVTKAAETDEDGLPMVTGRGPSDKEQRQLLEAAGWQAYSIRVGGKYVAYGRLDPFASILGLSADLVNYVKYAPPEDQSAVEDAVYGLGVSLANNVVNKTYLSGLASFADMLHDPQRSFPTWARTMLASFVPGQGAAAVAATDPNLREVRSMMDAARARWPGASDTLPPLRNVLGEPVMRAKSLGGDISSWANAFVPILYREVSDDVVNKEFAALQHGFTPPKRTRGGLDLTTVVSKSGQNAFDRWLELHGSVEIGGRSLRESLRRLMTSAQYKRIPVESTDAIQSPRIGLVQGVIDDYRAVALRQLIREYPELGAADRARVQQKAALLRGKETRPNPLAQALRPR